MPKPNIHPWNQELWEQLTLESERSNHALLFNGDIGLGKQALAFSLAHHVLTQLKNGPQSHSESLFDAGSHPDFHVIMPEAKVANSLAAICKLTVASQEAVLLLIKSGL